MRCQGRRAEAFPPVPFGKSFKLRPFNARSFINCLLANFRDEIKKLKGKIHGPK